MSRSQLCTSTNGDKSLLFHCPGCDETHACWVYRSEHPVWHWNGSEELPTLSPSVLVRYPHGDPPTERRCHSFVRDGRIQFLNDCTHSLAGQTVDLPEWEP